MSQYKFENPDNLSTRQLWLLGTSAMLTQLNLQRHDTLFPWGIDKTTEKLDDITQCLKRDWEVSNLADLSDTLEYLHKEKTFSADQHKWELLSDVEFQKAAQVKSLGSYRNVLHMVKAYQFNLHPGSDFAWHYGRCTWVIRMAAYVNYISEAEAWALLEENGERIKKAFNSWESFGASYMVGAQYWKSATYSLAANRRFMDNFKFLLTNKNSPWLNIGWDEY